MKIYRSVPEIDLANIAPLTDRKHKRAALMQLKVGRPPFSYAPLRKTILDILNVQPGPLVEAKPASWDAIRIEIIRHCKSSAEVEANLRVAEGLFDYAEASGITGRRHEFYPLPLGVSAKVNYWSHLIVNIGGRATVPFFDPRRTRKLTRIGRQFALSVMHERIRVADPDFAEVGLAIFQFANSEEGIRPPIRFTDESAALFKFDELSDMTAETYEMWKEVLDERTEEARRRASGGGLI